MGRPESEREVLVRKPKAAGPLWLLFCGLGLLLLGGVFGFGGRIPE